MCKTISNDLGLDLPKQGETWYIYSHPYTIQGSNYSYFETNGNPETRYITMQGQDGTQYIITHKAFFDKAEREKPFQERYITPGQILSAKPCDEGVWGLGLALGVVSSKTKMPENPMYEVTVALSSRGWLNGSYSTQYLYNHYRIFAGQEPDTAWLRWLAKRLNLVPKTSASPDRDTLKRLLGIRG